MLDATAKQGHSTEAKSHQSGATDEETLSEIEGKTKLSDTSKSGSEHSPEPDSGSLQRRNERDDAGPM